jgi:diguanylate cyclase (GGDEF)-like protein
LIYEGRVRGVISLTRLGVNQLDENALRLLEIIAAQAAIAFDRARLYDELRTEAVTDELTKLYNRRYLLQRFKEEKSRAIRNHHNLIALMLDIDRFKAVNDSFGHDAGDIVLRELAGVTRAVVRAEDIVSRYGGEEFCVLLPEIPLDDAEQVAERLRAVIERHRLPDAAGVRHIEVSIGMAILRAQDEGNELFTRADLAMYEVKHVGGNRVCITDGADFRFLGEGPMRPLMPREA